MIQTVIEEVFGFLVECLIGLFWWFILFPVVWVVSFPFILVIALFRREDYGLSVANMLSTVHCAWRDWGIFITP